MKMSFYGIKDVKANVLNLSCGIIPSQNEFTIKRGIKNGFIAKAFSPEILNFPGDFYLVHLYDMDTTTMEISPVIEQICCLEELKDA